MIKIKCWSVKILGGSCEYYDKEIKGLKNSNSNSMKILELERSYKY
jgi:hypothetical protein